MIFSLYHCAFFLTFGMRGVWGDNWRSAHVPTIPFTWLRRANAWTPSAHASNYQALFSLKLCEECRFNSCVRVFFIPWGHVSNHAQIWAFVTSISHMGQMRDSDWSREILLRSDWLLPHRSHMHYYGDCLIEVLLIQVWLNGNTWFFNFVKLFDPKTVCENPAKLVHVSGEDLIYSCRTGSIAIYLRVREFPQEVERDVVIILSLVLVTIFANLILS